MPKTIAEGFRVLRTNLEITSLQEQTVSSRQNAIREILEKDFAVKETFLTGSYRRSTMIAPLSDYASGMRYVFDKGISLVQRKLADPAGYRDDVAEHVNTQRGCLNSTL